MLIEEGIINCVKCILQGGNPIQKQAQCSSVVSCMSHIAMVVSSNVHIYSFFEPA